MINQILDSKQYENLIKKYNLSGPRYTSYPTAVQFSENELPAMDLINDASVSLYFHIPFCAHICYYCACNKVVTKVKDKANTYLHYLKQEIQIKATLLGSKPKVSQLHFGGGTPTFLTSSQLGHLMDYIRKYFDLSDASGEYSIEIDPRECSTDYIKALKDMGFNRLSFGVQDFNTKTQIAVNRVQPTDLIIRLVNEARQQGFRSINFDLIYGLPYQTLQSFNETLDEVLRISPDRLSIFNYAHLPHLFKPQRRINIESLPQPNEKIAILRSTTQKLLEHGYVFIGMDHFAKPEDELAIALSQGTLHRNFQGYTTNPGHALIGFGVSSISQYEGGYIQNQKTLDEYYAALDNQTLPSWRGQIVNDDDKLRREIIMNLICNFELSFKQIEHKYSINFLDQLKDELAELGAFASEGLVLIDNEGIRVTSLGRFFIRNICMAFDAYLPHAQEHSFSKVI